MRRFALLALTAALGLGFASETHAQIGRNDPEREAEEAEKRRQREEEWNQPNAPLPALRNAGPCPFVKVLYDAGRYHEFKGGQELASNVMYTGEIQGVSAGCEYQNDEPIEVRTRILFSLGKGPQATADAKTYRYWVAVTDRNRSVLAKEYFELPVRFGGRERIDVEDEIQGIVIPRAAITTSGSNFEVLIGFDVTPQMAAFNREGKRFRVNAGSTAAAASQ
ncbi:MAG TPA: Tat pathway signal sequence domain protein [Caulobacteraceae bacterium]|nr:Tat pathway signal sequence domain protein [Caulobacteraceae bacterium]